ncbi:MAG: hypothetical protein M1355_00950 [Patescibacteria group bacterium]|nr:hypothetical protein [Patescibacteria group bacterium]MCL5093692.1 hypothetical protein [Patescibacteria group bacterium]
MSKDKNLSIIFNSKARVKILKLFFSNNNTSFYELEVADKTKLPRTTTMNELRRLTAVGLLDKKLTPTKTFYLLDKKFAFFDEFESIIKKLP